MKHYQSKTTFRNYHSSRCFSSRLSHAQAPKAPKKPKPAPTFLPQTKPQNSSIEGVSNPLTTLPPFPHIRKHEMPHGCGSGSSSEIESPVSHISRCLREAGTKPSFSTESSQNFREWRPFMCTMSQAFTKAQALPKATFYHYIPNKTLFEFFTQYLDRFIANPSDSEAQNILLHCADLLVAAYPDTPAEILLFCKFLNYDRSITASDLSLDFFKNLITLFCAMPFNTVLGPGDEHRLDEPGSVPEAFSPSNAILFLKQLIDTPPLIGENRPLPDADFSQPLISHIHDRVDVFLRDTHPYRFLRLAKDQFFSSSFLDQAGVVKLAPKLYKDISRSSFSEQFINTLFSTPRDLLSCTRFLTAASVAVDSSTLAFRQDLFNQIYAFERAILNPTHYTLPDSIFSIAIHEISSIDRFPAALGALANQPYKPIYKVFFCEFMHSGRNFIYQEAETNNRDIALACINRFQKLTRDKSNRVRLDTIFECFGRFK